MKKIIIIIALLMLLLSACGEQERARLEKDRKSADEGLNRILTVYSNDGKEIKTYKGKFDIEPSDENGKVKFDIDGRRIIIYNAVIICEEVK
jgi:outer membrane lipoprotein-sorting protein